MPNGIINVYKERGWTSFDVVAKLRGITKEKKIGHTGTLDPDAEGVLPVCLGNATKVCGMLTDTDKTYRTVMLLGLDTDTQDISGKVLREADTSGVTDEMIREAAAGFIGEIRQIPPMYSAVKVNGRRLYDLARKGQTVERAPRKVTIYDITVESVEMPRATMAVRCSKGTYIRTLVHDIGERLGCGGTVESLIRTEAAGFSIGDALRIADIERLRDEGRLEECIRPVEELFADCPAVMTRPGADRLLYNGNRISPAQAGTEIPAAAQIRMLDSAGTFCGIYKCDDPKYGCIPVKMFITEKGK